MPFLPNVDWAQSKIICTHLYKRASQYAWSQVPAPTSSLRSTLDVLKCSDIFPVHRYLGMGDHLASVVRGRTLTIWHPWYVAEH